MINCHHERLFILDDIRKPSDVINYNKALFESAPYSDNDIWTIVKTYKNFKQFIRAYHAINKSLPKLISFDHDLGDVKLNQIDYDSSDEKTGYHCAQYLINFCMDYNCELPEFRCHSQNPEGKINILSLLKQYKRLH